MFPVMIHVSAAPVGTAVADGVGDEIAAGVGGAVVAGGGDAGDGVAAAGGVAVGVDGTTGIGLAADVQAAATSVATMIGVTSRTCDKRISCPFGRCTSGDVRAGQLLRPEPEVVPTRRQPHRIAPTAAPSLNGVITPV
jgi:hypothetical protein